MNARANTGATKRRVYGQPSWRLASSEVEAYVTELGGQLGPVTFERDDRQIQPYSVAPWAEEALEAGLPPVLQALRGDFFCLPFGGNSTPYHGERHPVHGETANARWRFESLQSREGRRCLHLSLRTKVRPGRVDKRITLVEGHNALYCQHVLSGMSGPMSLGHHAMLRFADEPECGVVSTSTFSYGQVFPEPVERPEKRGYSWLKPGARFASLEAVPTIMGESTDLSRYPARRGFEDIAMVVSEAQAPFAWTAVTFPKQRYVWFGLKNPRVLRQTVLWFSNGGRHYAPWNGRHVNVLGLEEVCGWFHPGLAESAGRNPLSKQGVPTCLRLNPHKPLVVNYVMGVAWIPDGFDRVIDIVPGRQQPSIVLRSASGRQTEAALEVEFVSGRR